MSETSTTPYHNYRLSFYCMLGPKIHIRDISEHRDIDILSIDGRPRQESYNTTSPNPRQKRMHTIQTHSRVSFRPPYNFFQNTMGKRGGRKQRQNNTTNYNPFVVVKWQEKDYLCTNPSLRREIEDAVRDQAPDGAYHAVIR